MKLSPISIPYRVVQRASSVVLVAFFAVGSGADRLVGSSLVVVGLAAVAVAALIAYEVAYYERFEYELTADTLDIRSGVISRREREIPYRRVQNVDIRRNVLQRMLGIAAVGLETAGGSRTEGSIRYASIAEAERLQREIQRRKRGVDGDDRNDEPDEEELFAITARELGLVGTFSFDTRIVGAAGLLASGSVPILSQFVPDPMAILLTAGGVLVLAGLLVASWLLGIAVAVVNYYGFRLTRDGDELRYERGLFRRYSGSIPLAKVQAITVEDNPLKRAFGYATLTVETAGYAPGGDGNQGSQAAVPIARRERVYALANEIEPFGDPDFERPPKRVRRRYAVRYLIVLGALAAVAYAVDWYVAVDLPWYGVAALVPLVPPAAHLKWTHRGYWLDDDHAVTRNGFWSRSIKVVPYYRVQTIIDSRTAFQRRWDVATVLIDTAGSFSIMGSGAAAVDIEIADAVELRETLNGRLRRTLAERRTPRTSGRPGAASDDPAP